MSDFNIHTDFYPGDEIKIVFDIYNDVPTSSDKTVYIVDLEEGNPHTLEPSSPSDGAAFYALSLQNTVWSNVTDSLAGAHSTDGSTNTTAIINQSGHTTSAAKVASDISRTISGVTYDDWYLPSRSELTTLFNIRETLDPIITAQGGSKLTKDLPYAVVCNYWASTESSLPGYHSPVTTISFAPSGAFAGGWFGRAKNFKARVRAVRKQITTDASVAVGSVFGGGVVYKVENHGTGITPTVDLDIIIGASQENIFSQNTLGDGYSNVGVEKVITSAHGSSPRIEFKFTNSNAGDYGWGANVFIFKKVEEVIQEVKVGDRATIAWSENSQRWTSRYSFTPEYFSTYKTCFASFVNGILYIHDDSESKNYFYNQSYPSKVTYIENIQPSQPKVFMTHAIEGNVQPTLAAFETVDNWTMNTDLLKEDYVEREGTYYSELFGDTNDPNVGDNATYGDKLMRGARLRGQFAKVSLTFRSDNLEVKHSNIGFITSKGHTTNGSGGGN